jgi:hypothetical protein
LAVLSFEFERIWWRLFQKCLVTTKLYIYVLFQLFLTCNALLHFIFSLQCVRPNLIPVLPFNFACSIFDIPYSYTYSQTRLKGYLYIANLFLFFCIRTRYSFSSVSGRCIPFLLYQDEIFLFFCIREPENVAFMSSCPLYTG